MKAMKRPRQRERGITLALVVISMVTFFALIVVAIDIGRIAHTAVEVQGIADAAAISGALGVIKQGAGNATQPATTAANANVFDGKIFIAGTNGVLTVEEGVWNPSNSPAFSPGASPENAVRVS